MCAARTKVSPIPEPREFRIDELFFSTTDRNGTIRSGNTVFARVSGYEMEELVGKPHSYIRHPDMPRAVFKLFWDYLNEDKPIVAYVKNMAADGRFYWVVALVTPTSDGYLSIRFKPSSPLFGKVEAIYKELLAIEASAGREDRRAGMLAASAKLAEILASLGFADYDAFMHYLLAEELKSREVQLKEMRGEEIESQGDTATTELQRIANRFCALHLTLSDLFASLDAFSELNRVLQSSSVQIARLTRQTQLLALNACIESARLEGDGATLSVVADHLGFSATRIGERVTDMTGKLSRIVTTATDAAFLIAAARLQVEMATVFCDELIERQQSGDRSALATNEIKTLATSFAHTCSVALQTVTTVLDDLEQVSLTTHGVFNAARELQFINRSGRIEAARCSQPTHFGVILEEVEGHFRTTQHELDLLTGSVEKFCDSMSQMYFVDRSVKRSLDDIEKDLRV